MAGVLSGMVVIEVGNGTPSGFCGRLLAGLDATVVKIEPPVGDPTRHARVVFGAPAPDPLRSPQFSYLGMGKRSLVAELNSAEDAERLREVLTTADVLLDDLAPGTLDRLGLGYDTLALDNPGLIATSLTAFGTFGPYAHWRADNLTAFAMGGQMSLTGEPDREPLCTAGEQAWCQTGLAGFAATMLALFIRERTGLGQRVDLAALEVMAGASEGAGPDARAFGVPTRRTGRARYSLMALYECADGFAGIFCGMRQIPALAEVLERPELVTTLTQGTMQDFRVKTEQLEATLTEWFRQRTRDEIREVADTFRLPLSPVRSVPELIDNRHLNIRGFFQPIETPDGTTLRVPGPLVRFGATPWRSSGPPMLGEMTWTQLEGLRRHKTVPRLPIVTSGVGPDSPRFPPQDRPAGGPLKGVRVLDFTAYWLGPYGTKWLADFGADVIKIESPRRLDFIRTLSLSASGERPWDKSAYFNNYSRGKRSFGVDPTHPDGRALILELVTQCDAVVENFQPGYLDRIGLSYEVLREARPELVMVSASAYGADGPDAVLPGVGTNMEQMSGIASLNRYRDSLQPYNTGIAYGDPTGGTAAFGGLIAALLHRERTGQGQHVEVCAHEVLLSLIGEQFAAFSLGHVPVAYANRHPDFAPHGCYPCEGEDSWVTISVLDDTMWRALCSLIERPDLQEALPTVTDRQREADEVDTAITAWTVTRSSLEVARQLQDDGIAAGPVLSQSDLPEDLHFRLRGYFASIEDPDQGSWPHDGVAWRLSRTPGQVRAPAPRFAQHTRDILLELHVDEARIASLYASGAIGDAPAR